MSKRSLKVEHLQLPPHSIEAEQSVLGGLMLDPAAWSKVSALVDEDAFFRPDHRLIFSAIADLQTRGNAIDPLTVVDSLEQCGKLADAGRPELRRDHCARHTQHRKHSHLCRNRP
jgi:replicative DNA helicase